MLPGRFPYMPNAHRMLPEHFPNTHFRYVWKVDENYFEHAQLIFELPNAEQNSQNASRTHRMLLEFDPFAFRTLKFIFGKETESIRSNVIAILHKITTHWPGITRTIGRIHVYYTGQYGHSAIQNIHIYSVL